MKIYLISILNLLTSFSNTPNERNKINGIVKNYHTNEPIVFLGVDLYINDTLTFSTTSDFDGKFTLNVNRQLNDNDFINIEFKYANDFSKKILLKNTLLKDLVIKLKTDTNLTSAELKKWKSKIPFVCGTKDETEEELFDFETDFELEKKP
jgi:hypothetical protein